MLRDLKTGPDGRLFSATQDFIWRVKRRLISVRPRWHRKEQNKAVHHVIGSTVQISLLPQKARVFPCRTEDQQRTVTMAHLRKRCRACCTLEARLRKRGRRHQQEYGEKGESHRHTFVVRLQSPVKTASHWGLTTNH